MIIERGTSVRRGGVHLQPLPLNVISAPPCATTKAIISIERLNFFKLYTESLLNSLVLTYVVKEIRASEEAGLLLLVLIFRLRLLLPF